MDRSELNQLSKSILDSSIAVHKEMGPGLLESIYEICLTKELERRGIKTECQVGLPLFYKGENLHKDFRIDMLVEDEVIVEIKALNELYAVHEAQVISYLKLANKRLGFLINFNEALLKNGFFRFVNNF